MSTPVVPPVVSSSVFDLPEGAFQGLVSAFREGDRRAQETIASFCMGQVHEAVSGLDLSDDSVALLVEEGYEMIALFLQRMTKMKGKIDRDWFDSQFEKRLKRWQLRHVDHELSRKGEGRTVRFNDIDDGSTTSRGNAISVALAVATLDEMAPSLQGGNKRKKKGNPFCKVLCQKIASSTSEKDIEYLLYKHTHSLGETARHYGISKDAARARAAAILTGMLEYVPELPDLLAQASN